MRRLQSSSRYPHRRGLVRAALLAGVVALVVAPATRAEHSDAELADVLAKLDRVAKLYLDSALSFSCEERVYFHTQKHGRKDARFFYVYRFDKDRGLDDFRLKYRFDPRKTVVAKDVVDLWDYGIPVSITRAYSWVFVFDHTKAHLFRYELAGDDTVFDRPARVVRFEALPPYVEGINEWIGKAWVDAETFQLLRVEAYRPDEYRRELGLQQALAALAEKDGEKRETFHSVERVTTEFEVLKNGMRFPSEVRIERRDYRLPGASRSGYLTYLLRQKYVDYQFFQVRTETEIRAAMASNTTEGGSR